jgi:hypothetical protein
MKYRMALWAGAGFLVAGGWMLYAFTTAPLTNDRMRDVWTLAKVTCPVIMAGSHLPLSLYWVLVANVATYVLVGLIVETLRHLLTRSVSGDGQVATPPLLP